MKYLTITYFIKDSLFTDVIKKVEIGFNSPYQKGLSKIYGLEITYMA